MARRASRRRYHNPITWSALDSTFDIAIAGASPDIEYIHELAAAVAGKSALTDLTVTGPGYRLNTSISSAKKYLKTRDAQVSLLYPSATPIPINSNTNSIGTVDPSNRAKTGIAKTLSRSGRITHTLGQDANRSIAETKGVAEYLETITGVRPTVLAYPEHLHDRDLMLKLRRLGFTVARDGFYGGTNWQPEQAWAQPAYTNTLAWETWDHWQPMELCLSTAADTAMTEALLSETTSKDTADGHSMYSLIFETTTVWAGSASTPPLSYTSWAALWKAKAHWVNVFAHLSPTGTSVTAEQVGWLLDVLIDDGDFWIADMETIAAYAYDYHAATSDDIYWEPTSGNTASDFGGAPWNGKKCAFTFSTDDGWDENVPVFAEFASRGKKMNCFIIQDTVGTSSGGNAYLTEAQILAGHQAGGVVFGVHAKTHADDEVAPNLGKWAFGFSNSGASNLAVSVESNSLKFHKDASADFHIQDLPYMEFSMEPWRWTGTYSNNDRVPSFTCNYTGTASATMTGNYRPTFKTSQIDSLPALEFADAEDRCFDMGNGIFWNDTRGFTVYAVIKPDAACPLNSRLMAKWDSTGNQRSISIERYAAYMSSDGTWGPGLTDNYTDWAQNAWVFLTYIWDPGTSTTMYWSTTLKDTNTSSIPSAIYGGTAKNIYIGNGRDKNQQGWDGLMAGMWVFSNAHSGDDLTNAQTWVLSKFPSLA